MAEFKKRMLILDTMVSKMSGGRTFTENYLRILEKHGVVVDYISFGNDVDTNRYFKEEYSNVNEFIDLKVEYPSLNAEKNLFDTKMMTFGVFFHNPMVDYMFFKKIYELMSRYVYDFVFVNQIDALPSLTQYFPIHEFVNTFVYTHCGQTFTPTPMFNGNHAETHTKMLRGIIKENQQIDLITQKPNKFLGTIFPDRDIPVIGMPLDVAKFHQYQLPEHMKEDAVLFLGRAHQGSKNIENWVDVVSKTGLKGIVIVPHKKAAETFKKLFEKAGFRNYEIHHSLTFEQKLNVSARCKVCYMPSFTENFPFVVYENMNLMNVVALDKYWSQSMQLVLPDLMLTSEDDAVKMVKYACDGYTNAAIEKQYQHLLKYNDAIFKAWGEYLNKPSMHESFAKKQVQIIDALTENGTLESAMKQIGRDKLSFTELMTLYRNIDMSLVKQTKDMSFYGDAKPKDTNTTTSLEAFL